MEEKRLQVAQILASQFDLPVRAGRGLFMLGSDRVLDVEFSEELAIPVDRVTRLNKIFAQGFRTRIAMVRRSGIYIKVIDIGVDGWLKPVEKGSFLCYFREDGHGEISPIRRFGPAPAHLFDDVEPVS